MIFSCSRDKTVRVWRKGIKQPIQTLFGHEMNVTCIDYFFNEGSLIHGLLVSGSRDAAIRVWDIETGTSINTRKLYRNLVTSVCALRDDKNQTFLQTSEDLTIRTWDVRSMDVMSSITGLINIPVSSLTAPC